MHETVTAQVINALIESGWRVLDSDFSEIAFGKWRQEVVKCLTMVCGADHPYTHYFRFRILKPEMTSILAGVGMLEAAGLHGLAKNALRDAEDPTLPSQNN